MEPSKGMLAVANRGEQLRNLAYAAGAAECIPLRRQSCDLAWLSHIWHHIRDHQACGRELRRIVSRGGHVLVRGTFGDQLDGFPTLFRVLASDARNLPATKEDGANKTLGVYKPPSCHSFFRKKIVSYSLS
jgi:ubiquinone/menaquinone biosynthesis C-methylase UbiE